MGLAPQLIESPESLKHILAFEGRGLAAPDKLVHLIFRSSDNIRLVYGARNICHFAWEFDVLNTDGLPHECITQNQLHMLTLVDEVWTQCAYSKDVLTRHGVRDVYIVPTPVHFESDRPRLSREESLEALHEVIAVPLALTTWLGQSENIDLAAYGASYLVKHPLLHAGGRVFLIICNPGDMRKNLLNSIEGFLMGSRPSDLLIVKLLIPNEGDYLFGGVYDKLSPLFRGPGCASSDRVLFTLDYLSDAQMAALYALADFYLSAPHCEGYNLPLLEAMAVGTVPVSNRHTAMIDYIDDSNSVIVEHKSYTGLIKGMAGDIARRSYAVAVSDRYQIAKAVQTASTLSPSSYSDRSIASQERVMSGHSEKAIAALLEARLTGLTDLTLKVPQPYRV
jgi:glycosyltransferase involved in cell wall biosynthesis